MVHHAAIEKPIKDLFISIIDGKNVSMPESDRASLRIEIVNEGGSAKI